jgi:hypothetical protein
MSLADLNGVDVLHGRLTLPLTGLWHADIVLDAAQDSTGPQALTLAGTTWTGATVRAIDFVGRRGIRIVAGTGGWRTVIPAKQYGALPASTTAVLSDAAVACGELPPVVDPSVPPYVGAAYLRANDRASLVLQQVLGDEWWADSSGRVQTAPRPATAIVSSFQALDVEGAAGWYEIATDFPGDWLPGATFSGPTVSGTVNRVEHTIEPERLRTRVMVA